MKILIATGIFEPEVGGPAMYAYNLAKKLARIDGHVTVVTFSPTSSDSDDSSREHLRVVRVVRGNKLLNRINFFQSVNKLLKKDAYDIVYMLDWFAAGLPAAIAAKLRGVLYVVRVGGDYLWEQRYLESGQKPLSLTDFYYKGIYQWWRYRVFFWLIRWVIAGAQRVVFNSDKQRKLYEKFYGLTKTSVIYNPVPEMTILNPGRVSASKEFVFWGRFIVMKNLGTLIRAFAKAKLPPDYKLTLIGAGPRKKEIETLILELDIKNRVNILDTMSRDDAWDRVKDSRALVIPSWTDISPNIVYEALAMGLPTLVTKENYLSIREQLPEMPDPHSVDDIAEKLEMLADDRLYALFARKFREIRFAHTWDDVLREHKSLFEKVFSEKV
jgi:glycosyltransferase involved in cell wall biosynthesis